MSKYGVFSGPYFPVFGHFSHSANPVSYDWVFLTLQILQLNKALSDVYLEPNRTSTMVLFCIKIVNSFIRLSSKYAISLLPVSAWLEMTV